MPIQVFEFLADLEKRLLLVRCEAWKNIVEAPQRLPDRHLQLLETVRVLLCVDLLRIQILDATLRLGLIFLEHGDGVRAVSSVEILLYFLELYVAKILHQFCLVHGIGIVLQARPKRGQAILRKITQSESQDQKRFSDGQSAGHGLSFLVLQLAGQSAGAR